MDNQKECPFKIAGWLSNPSDTQRLTGNGANCTEDDCALWLEVVYSTENLRQDGRCSIKFLAEKNSEGLLPV